MGALEDLARELARGCAAPVTGEIWRARATHATAESVECGSDALVVYRRSEPGFSHVGLPWCTPLALFLNAFASPDGHRDLMSANMIPAEAAAADLAPAAEVPQDASNRRNEAVAKSSAPAARLVLYVAHPLGVSEWGGLDDNLRRAMRWLSWLRRSFPETTFIAPWIAAVLSGEDDADPAQRQAGLVDADAVVARCDGVVLCGGRVSSGMAREREAARRVWDLTWCLGPEAQVPAVPRYPWLIWASESEIIVEGRLAAAEYSRQACAKSSMTDNRCEQTAETPKPCCARIGEGWCYLEAGHEGMCITATQRPLPVSDFAPGRARQ